MSAHPFRRNLALAVLALGGFAADAVGGTFASFEASTTDTGSSVTLDSLVAPGSVTAAAIGTDVVVDWTGGGLTAGGGAAGVHVHGRSLGVESGVRDGADPPGGCTADAAFDLDLTRSTEAAGSFTHAGVGPSADAGSWRCYRVQTDYPATPAAATWSSVADNPVVALQIGHVVSSIELVDGGTPGDLLPGDQLVVTFNQPADTSTGPQDTTGGGAKPNAGNDICVHSTNSFMIIGRRSTLLDTNCGSHANVTGRLNGVTMTPSGQRGAYRASYAWSACTSPGWCTVLTATLGTRYRGTADVTIDATGASLIPNVMAGTLLTSDGTPLCSGANNDRHTCRPIVTGSL